MKFVLCFAAVALICSMAAAGPLAAGDRRAARADRSHSIKKRSTSISGTDPIPKLGRHVRGADDSAANADTEEGDTDSLDWRLLSNPDVSDDLNDELHERRKRSRAAAAAASGAVAGGGRFKRAMLSADDAMTSSDGGGGESPPTQLSDADLKRLAQLIQEMQSLNDEEPDDGSSDEAGRRPGGVRAASGESSEEEEEEGDGEGEEEGRRNEGEEDRRNEEDRAVRRLLARYGRRYRDDGGREPSIAVAGIPPKLYESLVNYAGRLGPSNRYPVRKRRSFGKRSSPDSSYYGYNFDNEFGGSDSAPHLVLLNLPVNGDDDDPWIDRAAAYAADRPSYDADADADADTDADADDDDPFDRSGRRQADGGDGDGDDDVRRRRIGARLIRAVYHAAVANAAAAAAGRSEADDVIGGDDVIVDDDVIDDAAGAGGPTTDRRRASEAQLADRIKALYRRMYARRRYGGRRRR